MGAIAISSELLLGAIKRVEHAVADEMSRPILSTIRVEILDKGEDSGLRLIAADNYRIAWADIRADSEGFGDPILLRRESLPLLKMWLKAAITMVTMDVSKDRQSVAFSSGRWGTITVPLQDGMYPQWKQVIPSGPQMVVGLNPKYLADMGKSLGNGIVKMHIRDPLQPVQFDGYGGGEIIMPVKITDPENDLVPRDEPRKRKAKPAPKEEL